MGESGASLAELAERWLAHKAHVRPSSASEEARRRDLAVVGRRLVQGGDPADSVGLGDGGALAAALADATSSCSPATARRMLTTWRGFSRWLYTEGHVSAEPILRLDSLGPPPRPEELGVRVAEVVTTAQGPRDWPERDRAFLAVIGGGGATLAEATEVSVGEFDAAGAHLRLVGRGGWREVALLPAAVCTLDLYLSSRRERIGATTPSQALFVRTNGRAFTRDGIRYLVSQWMISAGAAPPLLDALHDVLGYAHRSLATMPESTSPPPPGPSAATGGIDRPPRRRRDGENAELLRQVTQLSEAERMELVTTLADRRSDQLVPGRGGCRLYASRAAGCSSMWWAPNLTTAKGVAGVAVDRATVSDLAGWRFSRPGEG